MAEDGWRRVCATAVTHGIPAAGHDVGPVLLRRLPIGPTCPRTCSRPSATTSAPTPTSGSTSPAASSSTPTGPAGAARRRRQLTTSEDVWNRRYLTACRWCRVFMRRTTRFRGSAMPADPRARGCRPLNRRSTSCHTPCSSARGTWPTSPRSSGRLVGSHPIGRARRTPGR